MKFLSLVSALFWLSCAQTQVNDYPVQTVPDVDIERYMGTWYEIARLPQTFQRKCGATKAEYSLRRDGRVDVVNTCQRLDRPGSLQSAKAIAKVVNEETNAELSVSFVPLLRYFGLFGGDYWILELGADYEYAVVGSPNRQSLWFLSRTPVMERALYEDLLTRVEDQGFNTKNLIVTPTWSL